MATTPTFSAEGAGMFKEQFGRNPKAEELQQFVAGTFKVPTTTPPTIQPIEGEVINRPIATPQTSYEQRIADLRATQKSEEQIRQEQLQQAQAMIDATNEVYQQEMGRLQEQGRERLQETRSIGVGAGLAGSPFQTAATSRTQAQTEDILAARRAERQAQIAQIRAQAMGEADKKVQQQLENFRAERDFLTSERDTEIARRAAEQEVQRETALGILGTFGSQGISASEIPVNEFRELLDQSGLSEFAASAYIDANKPQPEQSYQVANGKLIGYSVDPITGKVKVISEDIPGLESATEANIQTFGGVPYVITRDAQGNVKGSVLPGFERKTEDDTEKEELLSVTEAEKLGVPFGTTVSEASQMGLTPEKKTEKKTLSSEAAKVVSNVQSALNDIDYIRSQVTSQLGRGKLFDRQYKAAEANIIDVIGRLRSGGAITDDEVKSFKKLMPGILETDATRKSKLDRLQGLFNQTLQNITGGDSAIETETTSVDMRQRYENLGADESYEQAVERYGEQGVRQIIESISGASGDQAFRTEEQTSLKGGNVLSLGRITGYGSPYWKHGLDIDLKIGDPVPTPVSGKVIYAGKNGGFGNQVQIETPNGNKVWLSHLDAINVKVGDTISKGTVVGKGGNTGKVIPVGGGDGSHLDLTVQRPDGTYFTPKEIEQRLKQFA